jgi:hypothetical protein
MLKGYSTASVEMIRTSDGYCIRKQGLKVDFSIAKQRVYMELLPPDLTCIFDAPKIIHAADNYVIMDFINGHDILNLIGCGNVECIDSCIRDIMKLIKWEMRQSDNVVLTKDRVHYKFAGSVVEKECVVPYGPCHGDLSLSNIIFSDKLFLIDFNPNFIESPLWDIAKILQEVNLQWSFLLNPIGDTTKINIAYDYLRSKFNEEFHKLNIEWELIEYFYYMTLHRLLPYTDTEYIKTKIMEEIKKCEH